MALTEGAVVARADECALGRGDLHCDIREQLIAFLQQEHPTALPRARAESLRADTTEARQDTAPGMREDTQRDRERRARTAAP